MSLVPTMYSSADAGAPALSGTAGSLAAIFDAILVDGYGTGPSAKAPLGWTRTYSATNKRVYRNDPIEGSGSYLRLLDDGSLPGAARMAQVLAFSSMSDIDTGIGQTPTALQHPSGGLIAKSASADSTARPWWAIGNSRALYLFTGWYNAGNGGHHPFFFGDILSDRAGDNGAFLIATGPHRTTWAGAFTDIISSLFNLTDWGAALPTNTANGAGCYLLKSADGTTSSVLCRGVWPVYGIISSNTTYGHFTGTRLPAYPDPISQGLRWVDCLIGEGSMRVRGRLPGVIGMMHPEPFPNFTIIPSLPGLPAGASVISKSYQTGDYVANGLYGTVGFILGAPWQ